MPIYEFKCEKCGKEFEEMTGSQDMPPSCPECGSASRKLISACRRFKRSGGSDYASAPSTGGGCAGCSGGSCASCGR